MLIQGSSKRAIALYLNEHGVPSPSAYKVQKGLPVSTRGYDDPMWGVRMIHSILTNPTYTGDLAQGRSRVKSYKVHQIEAVPREEWVEVAGTHEAIIDYETFDKVQALLQRDTRTSPKGREVHADMNSGRVMNLRVTIPAESRRMNVGKDVIRILGSPAYICVLQRKDRKSIAITPCTAELPMSFKVPDRLLTDGQCRMMINGIQFIQALLEANGLAAGKDHQFKGRYDAEKNAVIISLKNGE